MFNAVLFFVTTLTIVARAEGQRLDPCDGECRNGGLCVEGPANLSDLAAAVGELLPIHTHTDINGFSCECPYGWTGLRCDVPFDTCYSNEGHVDHNCYNGGRCIPGLIDEYGNEELLCDCTAARDETTGDFYIGSYCERRSTDYCDDGFDFCANGGICNEMYPEENAPCLCLQGYEGRHCELKTETVPFANDNFSGNDEEAFDHVANYDDGETWAFPFDSSKNGDNIGPFINDRSNQDGGEGIFSFDPFATYTHSDNEEEMGFPFHHVLNNNEDQEVFPFEPFTNDNHDSDEEGIFSFDPFATFPHNNDDEHWSFPFVSATNDNDPRTTNSDSNYGEQVTLPFNPFTNDNHNNDEQGIFSFDPFATFPHNKNDDHESFPFDLSENDSGGNNSEQGSFPFNPYVNDNDINNDEQGIVPFDPFEKISDNDNDEDENNDNDEDESFRFYISENDSGGNNSEQGSFPFGPFVNDNDMNRDEQGIVPFDPFEKINDNDNDNDEDDYNGHGELPSNPNTPVDGDRDYLGCDLDCKNDGVCYKGVKKNDDLSDILSGKDDLDITHPGKVEHCLCQEGFIGLQCEIEIQLCGNEEHYCLHGSQCVGHEGSYSCDCSTTTNNNIGFAGRSCEHKATDICTSGVVDLTRPLSFCVNSGNCIRNVSAEEEHPGCICPKSWAGPHCELKSGFLDEDVESKRATVIDVVSGMQKESQSNSEHTNSSLETDSIKVLSVGLFATVCTVVVVATVLAARKRGNNLEVSEIRLYPPGYDRGEVTNLAPARDSFVDPLPKRSMSSRDIMWNGMASGDFTSSANKVQVECPEAEPIYNVMASSDSTPKASNIVNHREENGHDLNHIELV